MKLKEVVLPILNKQKLMEGQADRLIDDAVSAIKNKLSHVPFMIETLTDMLSWWESRRYSIHALPNTWKIFTAKLVVTAIYDRLTRVAVNTYVKVEYPEEIAWLRNKLKKKEQAASIAPNISGVDVGNIAGFIDGISHSSGIQYEPIQNFNPLTGNYKYAQDILDDLGSLEDEYQEKQKEIDRYLEPTGKEEVVINFPDGLFWVHLNVGTCRKEADAMQHCGNSNAKQGDTILSLREEKTKDPNNPMHALLEDGVTYHYPYLTFIINDGYLGEMKGFNNQKPSHRYHPYIVELLKHPMVKGIYGHGYLAQNNFKLEDLNEAQLEEVRQAKSDDFIDLEGLSKDGQHLWNKLKPMVENPEENIRTRQVYFIQTKVLNNVHVQPTLSVIARLMKKYDITKFFEYLLSNVSLSNTEKNGIIRLVISVGQPKTGIGEWAKHAIENYYHSDQAKHAYDLYTYGFVKDIDWVVKMVKRNLEVITSIEHNATPLNLISELMRDGVIDADTGMSFIIDHIIPKMKKFGDFTTVYDKVSTMRTLKVITNDDYEKLIQEMRERGEQVRADRDLTDE